MPLGPSSTARRLDSPIEDYSPTILERVTAAPFNILGAPSNAVKSIIRAVKEESWADAANAVQSLIPFAGSEEVSASSITGSDSFLTNLAFDIATDPTMLVGNVAGLTGTGRAALKVADRAAAVKVLERLGTAEDLVQAKKALTVAEEALKVAKLTKPNEPARNLVKFAGKDIGNFDVAKTLAGKLNPMPDVRRSAYELELMRINQQLKKVDPFSNKASELLGKSQKLKESLIILNRGVIPISAADKIRSVAKTAAALFKHSGNNELLETAKDVTLSNNARAARDLGVKGAETINEIEILARERGVSILEQQERLVRGAEFRSTLAGSAPDIESVVLEKSQAAYKKYISDLKVAAKIKDPLAKTEHEAKVFQKFKASVNAAKFQGEEARLAQVGFLQETVDKPYTVGEINTLDKIRDMYEGLPKLESDNLLISTDLKSSKGMIEYTRRLLTPEAKTLRDKKPSLFSLIHSEFGVKLGAAKKRNLYPEKDILTINKLIKEDYGINFDFFDTNVVKAMMDRRAQSYKAINSSQYIQFAIDNMARPGLTKKEGYTAGYIAKRLNGKSGPFDVEAFKKKWKGLRVPKDQVDEILGTHRILNNSLFNNNVGVGKVMQVVDKINAPFRIALTTLFPGYHHRNKIGNVINSWIGGINPVRQAKYELEAGKLLKAIHTGKATPEQVKLMDRLIESRILEGGISAETKLLFDRFGIKDKNLIGKLIERPISTLTGVGKGRQFDALTGRAYGKYIEDTSRIAHFLAKKADGLTDLEAMRHVNKYLFDFTKLTDFEKKFARPSVLFYSWTRNNIPLQLRTMIDNPRILEGYNILTGQNDEDVPQYLRSSSSFKSPFGKNEVIGSLGLPQEDLNIANVAAADPGGFQQASALADNFITRLSPAFRIPIEIAMGRTTYGRKPLQDLTLLQKIKEFTPLSRFVTTGKKVVDPEIDLSFKMLDILTGVRTYAYDPDRVRIDKMKRAALKSGKFQRSGFLVIPKEQYKKDEDVKKQTSKLQKAIRQLAEKKKKEGQR